MTVKNVLYGTEDYVSHIVKVRTVDKVYKDILYGSFMDKEKARKKAKLLANEFNVPLIRI